MMKLLNWTNPLSGWRILIFSAVTFSAAVSSSSSSSEDVTCISHDEPNPIATTYPSNATGLLNATMVIVPIPLTLARKVIPSKWPILEKTYRSLLPDFPADKYPMLLQGGHAHDINIPGIPVPDFSKIGISFPFIDRLNDGVSSFHWVPHLFATAGHDIILQGALAFGIGVSPSAFEPECNAYGPAPSSSSSSEADSHFFRGQDVEVPDVSLELSMRPLPPTEPTLRHREGDNQQKQQPLVGHDTSASSTSSAWYYSAWSFFLRNTTKKNNRPDEPPYPVSFYRNITNQPYVGNVSMCNQQIRLFNADFPTTTTITTPPSFKKAARVHVRGRVAMSSAAPFKGDGLEAELEDAIKSILDGGGFFYGLNIATPFIESAQLECEDLKYYDGADLPGY